MLVERRSAAVVHPILTNPMKKPFLTLAAACGLLLPFAPAGFAAPSDYQVTGPITALTDSTVTVQKGGKENFEFARDASFKAADGSELKVGDKVTIHYTLSVKSVEKKDAAKADKKPAGKAGAAPAASASPAKP